MKNISLKHRLIIPIAVLGIVAILSNVLSIVNIRNVNQRIKLVYGEEYGLEIKQGEDDRTVSTITIPYVLEKGL